MPRIDTALSLETAYASKSSDDRYSYSTIDLKDSFRADEQLAVRWRLTTVTKQTGGTAETVNLADLPFTTQEAITLVPTQLFSVDESGKNVILQDIGDRDIVVGLDTFVIPTYNSTNVSSFAPIVIQRSTDIADASGIFSPGARLTSAILNASNDRALAAIEELTFFGTESDGGGSGGGSASLADINEIGNVNIAMNNNALLAVSSDGASIVSTTASLGGTLLPNGGLPNQVLIKDSVVDGDAIWADLDANNVQYGGSTLAAGLADISIDIQDLESKTVGITRQQDNNVDITFVNDPFRATANASFAQDVFMEGDVNVDGNINLNGSFTGSFSFGRLLSDTGATFGFGTTSPSMLNNSTNGLSVEVEAGAKFQIGNDLGNFAVFSANDWALGNDPQYFQTNMVDNGSGRCGILLKPRNPNTNPNDYSFYVRNDIDVNTGAQEADLTNGSICFGIKGDGRVCKDLVRDPDQLDDIDMLNKAEIISVVGGDTNSRGLVNTNPLRNVLDQTVDGTFTYAGTFGPNGEARFGNSGTVQQFSMRNTDWLVDSDLEALAVIASNLAVGSRVYNITFTMKYKTNSIASDTGTTGQLKNPFHSPAATRFETLQHVGTFDEFIAYLSTGDTYFGDFVNLVLKQEITISWSMV